MDLLLKIRINIFFAFILLFLNSFFVYAVPVFVSKLSQTIDFSIITDKTCKDSVFSISATASSGLPITYSVVFGNALIQSNSVTLTGAGSVIIKAFQAGDAIYDSVSVTQQFEVTSAFYDQGNTVIYKSSSICEGSTINWEVSSAPGITTQWSGTNGFASNLSKIQIPNVTSFYNATYNLKISEALCLFVDYSFNLTVIPRPLVSILSDFSSFYLNDSIVELQAIPLGGVFSGRGVLNLSYSPEMAGLGLDTIVYRYIDSNNCSSSARLYVEIIKEIKELKIYELVTSRKGSKHGTWLIDNIDYYPDNEVFVYNSWGELVYNKKKYNNENGWDAHDLVSGSYLYIVKKDNINPVKKGVIFVEK